MQERVNYSTFLECTEHQSLIAENNNAFVSEGQFFFNDTCLFYCVWNHQSSSSCVIVQASRAFTRHSVSYLHMRISMTDGKTQPCCVIASKLML